jgi:NhaC family Na+:H+ antiporter
MQSVFGATQIDMGTAELNDLVSTGGMAGMMDTIWLILCAMCFGGVMSASGFLAGISRVFLSFVRRTFSLVASTVGSGLLFNIVTADQYISIILTGNMFKETYHDNGYEARLLSRTTEDAVTVTSPLIPWNTCGMTQATVMGVATWIYLPYAVFNYLCPVFSIIIAITGYRIFKKHPSAED